LKSDGKLQVYDEIIKERDFYYEKLRKIEIMCQNQKKIGENAVDIEEVLRGMFFTLELIYTTFSLVRGRSRFELAQCTFRVLSSRLRLTKRAIIMTDTSKSLILLYRIF
jgi:hypothetical protein